MVLWIIVGITLGLLLLLLMAAGTAVEEAPRSPEAQRVLDEECEIWPGVM